MSRVAYVNGRYLSRRDASVNIEDRGYQFADGVYELCEVREGRLIDERRHIERLRRSLNELKIAWPLAPSALAVVMRETIRRNRLLHIRHVHASAGGHLVKHVDVRDISTLIPVSSKQGVVHGIEATLLPGELGGL